MHPDRKIGIAMGILLIGVVAALFFRNEPLATDEGLTADREQQLNERLRDRDVTVFLDDTNNSQASSSEQTPQWSMPELLGALTAQEDEVPIPIGGPRLVTPPADDVPQDSPVAVGETPETDDGRADSRRTSDGEQVAADTQAGHGPTAEPAPSEPDYIEYTVQFGDTLSEISEKFLGSQTRFREIYEINKDRMQSPDRLRVGKAIRIPRTFH